MARVPVPFTLNCLQPTWFSGTFGWRRSAVRGWQQQGHVMTRKLHSAAWPCLPACLPAAYGWWVLSGLPVWLLLWALQLWTLRL